MGNIFRNNIVVTAVHNGRGKQFAFGITQEPEMREIFFPYWIVKAFEMTKEDEGLSLDCIFIDRPDDKNPMVLAILDEDIVINGSKIVGEYVGTPGHPDFSAIVTTINRKPS